MKMFEIPKGNYETFGFCAENPTGSRNGGTRGGDCDKLNPAAFIKAGETITLCETDGPGMVTHMWFGSDLGHNFVLRMYWDNNPEPSVEAPISAFFGHAYDYNMTDRDGNYITMSSEQVLLAPRRSYNSYWEMPFRTHCKITLENRGYGDGHIYYMITGYRGEIPEEAGYFHAGYTQERPVTKGKAFTVVDTIYGKGRFAGMFLAVGLNGEDQCWVEGEARMYIDGDIYPSMNYTGTEDYFGGSFNFGNDFGLNQYMPFCGQYVGMYAVLGDMKERYNNQQRFLLYRWHVRDPIFFNESFRMVIPDMSNKPRYDDFAAVSFWYLTEPKALPMKLPPERELDWR